MAKINASSFLLFIDGNPIGASTSSTLTIEVETPDTSTKDSEGWAEHLAGGGQRSSNGSTEGFEDPSKQVNVQELYDLIDNRSDFDFQLTDDTAGSNIWIGKATITNLEMEYEMEQPVSLSFDWKVNGKVERVVES